MSATSSTTSTGTGPVTGTPVERHGSLQVMGNRVVDAYGAELQLKGMSLFWSVWEGEKFYNASAVNTLVDGWDVSVVRAAMTVSVEGRYGYLHNPDAEKRKVKTIVDAAIARGIYVIIDWHDHDAALTNHKDAAKRFFREMATEYGDEPGVIFEVYNEPDNESWAQVKSYAEEVIGEIRGAGADNLVIVGTPTWSQDVDVAARNPITRYSNIAYTLHFYAATHKAYLRTKATDAMTAGLPLFVTEWGTCSASGDGALDLGEAQTWLDFLSTNKISWLNWSIVDKAEACAALRPGAGASGPWSDGQLTESGRWVKAKIQAP
ncbi:glycoside hydrolase family 5 protein (plasmid) [Sorangium sp. So ce119]|uniref:glycoside hydrolase family 5 protein n=1 Tax=Sorangium sp. So ce119 TaxID=3133279 RepID=UPI003F614BFF